MAISRLERTKGRVAKLVCTWLLLLVSCSAVAAAPVTGEILDYYDLKEEKGNKVIEVYFTAPIFYMGHFPASSGNTLVINVYAVAINNRDRRSLYKREGLVVNQDRDYPLTDIEYSYDDGLRSHLILEFAKNVKYRVSIGDRFESMRIELLD